jgi:hypothetical protein
MKTLEDIICVCGKNPILKITQYHTGPRTMAKRYQVKCDCGIDGDYVFEENSDTPIQDAVDSFIIIMNYQLNSVKYDGDFKDVSVYR